MDNQEKLLKRVKDKQMRDRVEAKMHAIVDDPLRGEVINARRGEKLRRQREGHFRITYKLTDTGVEFVDVTNRAETYRPRRMKG